MDQKNMADVADKAIDKVTAGVEAVAKAVEKVAPHVWEILVRQATTQGAVDLALGVALVVAAVALFIVCFRRLRSANSMDASDCYAFVCLLVIVPLFLGVMMARSGGLRAANPEYYAARELIEAARR